MRNLFADALYPYKQWLTLTEDSAYCVYCVYNSEAVVTLKQRSLKYEVYAGAKLVSIHTTLNDALVSVVEVVQTHIATKLWVKL